LEHLQQLSRQLERSGGTALPVRADLSREADCRHLGRITMERFGRIDALINAFFKESSHNTVI
jgi:NAD(P)-dependent dehydrogenase (short-subunit alcohol dehydrogenase family)